MEPCQNCSFASVSGVIVDMAPESIGAGRAEGCILNVTLEDDDGNTVKFLMGPDTFVVDWETLTVGRKCVFWYRTDAPMPLIYPPQYRAAVAARVRNDRMIDVSFYNDALINEEQTLQLFMNGSVNLRTTNNQYFQGSPVNHNLVVLYDNSTRSIPAQTTPKTVVVLCGGTNR